MAAWADGGGPSESHDDDVVGPIPSGHIHQGSGEAMLDGDDSAGQMATSVATDDMELSQFEEPEDLLLDVGQDHEVEVDPEDPWFAGLGLDDGEM